jgi:hypothetical protein
LTVKPYFHIQKLLAFVKSIIWRECPICLLFCYHFRFHFRILSAFFSAFFLSKIGYSQGLFEPIPIPYCIFPDFNPAEISLDSESNSKQTLSLKWKISDMRKKYGKIGSGSGMEAEWKRKWKLKWKRKSRQIGRSLIWQPGLGLL